MKFTKEQKKEAYEKLPREAQFFVMSNDTSDLVTVALGKCGLSEVQMNMADSEILWAMYGLQNLLEAITNIAKITNKKPIEFSKLKLELETNVFNTIDDIKNKALVIAGQETITSAGKSKTIEVGKKYSLKDEQIEKLSSLVKTLAENPEQKDSMIDMIVVRLGVSRILADQIATDLKTRVFTQTQPQPKIVFVKPETKVQNNPIPEIRPEIVPMVEKGEVAHDYKPVEQKISVPSYIPENIPMENKPEPVQRPVPVPRFVGVKIEDVALNTVPNIADAKLTGVVKNTSDITTPVTPTVPIPTVTSETKKQNPVLPPTYTIDPYREPLT